jgi:hypothetical protein
MVLGYVFGSRRFSSLSTVYTWRRKDKAYTLIIDYDLFQVLIKKLKTWYEHRQDYGAVHFAYDGEVMRIHQPGIV